MWRASLRIAWRAWAQWSLLFSIQFNLKPAFFNHLWNLLGIGNSLCNSSGSTIVFERSVFSLSVEVGIYLQLGWCARISWLDMTGCAKSVGYCSRQWLDLKTDHSLQNLLNILSCVWNRYQVIERLAYWQWKAINPQAKCKMSPPYMTRLSRMRWM